MFWTDLIRVFIGRQLYRLDRLVGPKLLPLFYLLGLAALSVWAISHLVLSFTLSFSQGLWGVLEIVVYGAFWVIGLRVLTDLLLVLFKVHDTAFTPVNRGLGRGSLLDDVNEAVHDLAADEDASPML